jgi:ATP/ADP translocase
MKTRILKLLKLKHTESRHVTDLLTVQFWIGISNAFVNIAAFYLFISYLKVPQIPLAYLYIAGALLVLNLIYEKLEHRFSPQQLIKVILGAYVVLLVVSVLMYMVTGYAFWGLVSQLYNIRESKRVFSVVGSGDIPAKLLGYMLVTPIAHLIGYPNLIWVAVLCLLIGLYQFDKVIRKKRWDHIRQKEHDHHHHEMLTLRKRDYISFFFKTELIFAISLISLISYNVFNLVDYTFLSQVKYKYYDRESLALFLAVFFGLGRLVALVMKLVFTSRVIERMGVIACLFITPLTLLAFCFLFFFAGDDSDNLVYIFGGMALLTEVLRSTIQEPVYFILFQPLKEQLRLKGHLIAKGYMMTPSLVIVGLSLILIQRSVGEITIPLTVKILLVNLMLWAGSIFLLRKSYLRTLRQSIQKGFFAVEDVRVSDQQSIDILLEKIKSGKETNVLYALKLLENAEYPHLASLYRQLLVSPHREIRRYVLEMLSEKGEMDPALLREMLPKETDPDIRQQLVSVLCKSDPAYLPELSGKIDSQEPGIRKVIITSMLNQREFRYLLEGGNSLNKLIFSNDPAERELAIDITTDLRNVRFTDAIEQLIHDPVASVKRQAIIAACKLKIKNLLPYITKLLQTPSEKYLALQGMQQYGDELFLHLRDLPETERTENRNAFIKLAGKCRGHHSTHYLLACLADGRNAKDEVIHALWSKDYEPTSSKEVEELNGQLTHFLETANRKVRDFYEVPPYPDQKLLQESIDSEIRNDLNSALRICALLYNKTEFNRILELLEHSDQNRLMNAIEMLELVLPKRIAKEMNLVFDYLLDPTLHRQDYAQAEINSLFSRIVFTPEESFGPWTRAVCIYSSWKNRQSAFLASLKSEPRPKEHYIVQETRDFVLNATEN